jgi:hypothetical protein
LTAAKTTPIPAPAPQVVPSARLGPAGTRLLLLLRLLLLPGQTPASHPPPGPLLRTTAVTSASPAPPGPRDGGRLGEAEAMAGLHRPGPRLWPRLWPRRRELRRLRRHAPQQGLRAGIRPAPPLRRRLGALALLRRVGGGGRSL